MGRCRNCGKSGFFLNVDARSGTCAECTDELLDEYREYSSAALKAAQVIQLEVDWRGKIKGLKKLEFAREMLSELEAKGICPGPSINEIDSREVRRIAAASAAQAICDRLEAHGNATKDNQKKIAVLNEALIALGELEKAVGCYEFIDLARQQANEFLKLVTQRFHLEAGKKAEFKGKSTEALNHYQEALYLLKECDSIPDKNEVEEIESKVERLRNQSM